jgi:hypothetical protein
MNQEVLDHIESSLNEVRALFVKAAERIEAIKPGEKIPATKLAEDLAKEQSPDQTGPQLYTTLKILFEGYPGVDIRRGAHGGIYRLLPGEVKGQKKTAAAKPADGAADAVEDKGE